MKFTTESTNLLVVTNNKWFINLTNIDIPPDVSSLLQLGQNFSLSTTLNKNTAIHEMIKDIECIKSRNLSRFLPKVRNTAIPQFHKFLHNKNQKNIVEDT